MASLNTAMMAIAQEERLTLEQLESRLLILQNPFQSQLPKRKVNPVKVGNDKPQPTEITQPVQPIITQFPVGITDPVIVEPPEPVEIPMPEIDITGIIWNAERPQAIINGQIIDVGDKILDIEIMDIQKTGIEGLFHGRPVMIKAQRSQI